MAIPIVKEVLEVIRGGIEYLTLLQSTSHIRKLRRAIDWAEKYIDTNESNVDDKKKRLAYLKKKFKKYNGG